MPGFKTHITGSTLLGIGYGGAAYVAYGVPWPTCALAAGLCSVSGMLPDIDSDSSTPQRESMAFASAVVPLMLMHRFQHWGMTHEMILLAGAAVYLAIRFGAGALLRMYTVHRGMFHSIPAALVAGEGAFLLASGDTLYLRLYTAGAVMLGYLSHLVLDEIWSVEWTHGMHLKKSFGTALKLFGEGMWSNVSCYAKVLILTAIILFEPQLPDPSKPGLGASSQQTAGRLIDRIWHR
ncbi:MAG: metal-dependent hydrolase [Thermoguttaceae bacterium]|jgi:membrane-bound metal-dependent hydrolase YbcI (DUF457 family)